MAGEKFTVTLSAKIKDFIANMKKASKSIKSVGMQNRGLVKNIQQMSSSFNQSGKRFFQTTQKFKTGVDGIGRSTSGLSKKLAGATAGLAAFGPAAIAAAAGLSILATSLVLFRKALRIAEIGAAFKVQAKAFANLVANQGLNAETLVKQLKDASKGTLDTMSIITTASRALLLRIPANRLTDLMDVARKASKAMGTTVSGAFSDISLGIGRQSRLILDNLGIIVRVGVAYDNYARKIGVAVGSLTDFEKSQAFMNEALDQAKEKFKDSAPNVLDFRDRMDQIRALVSDAMKRISVAILVPFEALFKVLADKGVAKWVKNLLEVKFPASLEQGLKTFIIFLKTVRTAKNDLKQVFGFISDFNKTVADVTGITDLSNMINTGISKIWGFAKGAVGAAKAVIGHTKAVEDDTSTLGIMISETEKLTEAVNGFKDSLLGQGGLRPSLVDVAHKNVISLTAALEDTVSKAADISAEFAKGLPLIEDGIEALADRIRALTPLLSLSASGRVVLEQLQKEQDLLQKQKDALDDAFKGQVSTAQFLESKGLSIDERKIEEAKQAAGEMERLIASLGDVGATSQEEVGKIGLKIFTDTKINLQAVDKATRESLLKSKKIFEDMIPKKAIKKNIKEIKNEMAEIIPVDTIKGGLNKWVDDFNNSAGRITAAGVQMAQAMSTGFDNFLFDSVMGNVNSLEDAFNNMFKSILRQMTKFIGDKATQEFLGLAFGATGQQTQSRIGLSFSSLSGRGLFGSNAPISAPGGGPPAPGGSGFFSGLFGGLGKILGFADGGIANFANASGSAMVASSPQLAAIAEKPGKKEAVMPLEKFTDLVQPVNINISTVDTKSFQQYMMDNKEIVLGTIMGIKGSRTVDGMQRQQRGPF